MDASDQAHLSPTFNTGDDTIPARETKFVITPDIAETIAAWLDQRLIPDPHGDPKNEGRYVVHTTCLDSPEFATYYREFTDGDVKYRVRRYGDADVIYAEKKSKQRGEVSKERVALPISECHTLLNTNANETASGWFREALATNRLGPVCHLTYTRQAWFGNADGRPFRVTLDRDILVSEPDPTTPGRRGASQSVLPDGLVLEMKYRDSIPSLLKELIESYRLVPVTISKYRRGLPVLRPHLAKNAD